MKTLKDWEDNKSDIDLIEYLGEKPCEIDWDLCEHIECAYVASNYSGIIKDGLIIAQNGEAEDSFDEFMPKERYTYMTVMTYPDGTYWYLGVLPDLNREE